MKISGLYALGLALLSILWITACAPAKSGSTCGDPALVAIPETDASAPEITWVVIHTTPTPEGSTTDTMTYVGNSTTINARRNDLMKIYLIAKDEESGIKNAKLQGGYNLTCKSAAGNSVQDGFLPGQSVDLSFFTECSIREWKLNEFSVELGMNCGPGSIFAALSFGFTGIAENTKGGKTTSVLSIIVGD